jgi:hypothetical protein
MKKLFHFIPVLLVMLLSACSNQDFVEQSDSNTVNVSFSTELPGQITTRGWGDGITATELSWAVYLKDTKTLVKQGNKTLSELKTSVSINLIKGRSYDVVFWAQSPDAPYTFDADNQKVEMNYTEKADELVANSEDYDAFYAKAELENVSADTPGQTVILKRPFVQVMFMTNITENMYGCPYVSTFSTKAYPEFDLIAGEPTGTQQDVTFGANNCDQDGYLFTRNLGSNGKYFMVSSAYFLANSESSLADCTMTAGDFTQTAEISEDGSASLVENYEQIIDPIVARNIPVQANYRVCLIGNLFSKDVTYDVEVDPNFTKTVYYWASGFMKYDTELDNIVAEGGEYTVDEDETFDHAIHPHGTDVVIEIAEGKTLSFNTTSAINISDGATLTIKGGTVDFPSSSGTTASFWIGKGSSLVLENVNVVSNGAAIYPQGNAAKVEIRGGSIKGGTYGIGTNANSVKNYDVEITVEDAEITSDNVATFINIPGKITLKNVKSHGKNFGLIARGGTVNVTNSTIISDSNCDGQYWTEVWKDGTRVACAALTLGNRHETSYQYPTYVTLTNTKVTGPADGYAIYGWANADAENGVWFDYDTDTTITGDQYYGSDNITVNGSATKTEGNPKRLDVDE